jgi:hypothetical protein
MWLPGAAVMLVYQRRVHRRPATDMETADELATI